MGRQRSFGLAAVLLAGVVPATGAAVAQEGPAPSPVVTDVAVVPTPPGSTDLGSAYSTDGQRLVAAATTAAGPVVHVFDSTAGGWSHTGTIAPPPGATSSWGAHVAVSGDTVAVTDPGEPVDFEVYGTIEVYERSGGTWSHVQEVRGPDWFSFYAGGVWLAGDLLITTNRGYCESSCWYGEVDVHGRGADGRFVLTAPGWLPTSRGVSVGVDGDRFVAGHPGFTEEINFTDYDNRLRVGDSGANGPVTVFDETVPWAFDYEAPQPDHDGDWYRATDVSGDVVVHENCCDDVRDLRIRRLGPSGTATLEAILPVSGASDALVALPDVVLRLDAAAGVFRSHVHQGGTWSAGDDVVVPGGVAPCTASSPCRPVAAGNRVVVRSADGGLRVLTVERGPARCFGREVTVDLGAGGSPTAGDDVILGTAGPDDIVAGPGNDVVCAGPGDDIVRGGPDGDLVDGGTGHDTVLGGTGADIITGGEGDDAVQGGDGGDIVLGAAGADHVTGGPGDDWIVGGDGDDTVLAGAGSDLASGGPGDDVVRGGPGDDLLSGDAGDDRLWGGADTDVCHGGADTDIHVGGCETTTGIP